MINKTAIEKQIGTIINTGDSVNEVREIRNKLSKTFLSASNLDEINALGV